MITRAEFLESLEDEFQQIKDLFTERNKSYGADGDLFYNFRQSAIRHFGDDSTESMFKVAEILVDKHNVALANKGANDPACEERLNDRIVYSLLQKAMLNENKTIDCSMAHCISGGYIGQGEIASEDGTERK